jgi:hypothetical protein
MRDLRHSASATLLAALLASPLASSAQPVTGAELQSWLDADGMAVAGLNVMNGCHFIAKGTGSERRQSIYCPNNPPFTVTGEARVQGDQFCARFTYPDNSRYDSCQDVLKVGDNKYEFRLGGVLRSVFYRLIR